MSSWKTRDARIRDILDELVGTPLYRVAEMLIDKEDDVSRLEEKVEEQEDTIKSISSERDELIQQVNNLESKSTHDEGYISQLESERDSLQEKLDHLKAISTMLNYRKDPV